MINWENSGVYVNEIQIMSIVKRCKGKSPEFVVKKLMDGFFNPWDVGHLSATMLLQLDGVVGKIMCALQCKYLNVHDFWNLHVYLILI